MAIWEVVKPGCKKQTNHQFQIHPNSKSLLLDMGPEIAAVEMLCGSLAKEPSSTSRTGLGQL